MSCRSAAMIAAALTLAMAASAGAQASSPLGDSSSDPAVSDSAAAERVQPFDSLEVSVLQLPDMNRTVEVNAIGVISLPLAGDFNVAGKTTKQISADIAERLGRHDLQNPQVTVALKDASQGTVSLKEAGRRGFTVEGSVAQPGVYSIYGPTTLLQGLALAKGLDQYANEKRVTIFREAQGRAQSAVYNLADIRDGKAIDPPIYPKDIIEVAGSKSKRFLRDFGPLIPLIYLLPRL